MAGDDGQDAAGLERVDRLGDEIIVQREFPAVVVIGQVLERHVADHRVKRR